MGKNVLPLGFLQNGRTGIVKDLNGGHGIRHRLTEMGLVHDTKIRMIKNDLNGPLIISLGEGRLALGRGMATRIMIEEDKEV